jgi:ribosomal protein S8
VKEIFKALLTIKNSLISKHENVSIKVYNPNNIFKILRILYEEGFILTYIYDKKLNKIHVTNNIYNNKSMLSVLVLYNKVTYPVFLKYTDLCAIHKFGVDLLILSTSRGILPHYMAMKYEIGGKLICYIR